MKTVVFATRTRLKFNDLFSVDNYIENVVELSTRQI